MQSSRATHLLLGACLGGTVTLTAAMGHAQTEGEPPPASAYPPGYGQTQPPVYVEMAPAPESSAHRPRLHKGFYMRLGMGLGMFDDSAEVETFVRKYGVSGRGTSIGFDFSLGGSIQPGVVLAGTLLLDIVPSPRIRQHGSTDDDGAAIIHDLVGATLEFYPDPRGGFFTGMTAGYATMSIEDASREVEDATSEGIGIAPHVGYGWWSDGRWGVGLLGRFRYSHMTADVDDGLPAGIQRDSVVMGTLEIAAILY